MFNFFKKKVVTRIAPSPTGPLHVGTARSALFNFLFARQHKGTFIIRIEDTDKKRSKKEFENDIMEGLAWLGIQGDLWYRQSERRAIYTHYIEKLLVSKAAYISEEKRKDAPDEKIAVIRLKNPNTILTFRDMIRGPITFDTTELGDFVIARSAEDPLYHMAVVIDDSEMSVTHVIRGEDHVSNTPRQILIQNALGIPTPQYAHIPLILAPDRSKLSKRGGSTSMHGYKEEGYLPEALINYLALLGWSPDSEQELFSMKELVRVFDITRVHKGGAIFDKGKLDWFNQKYIQKLSLDSFTEKLLEFLPNTIKQLPNYNNVQFQKIVPLLQERMVTLKEIESLANDGELDYFFEAPKYDPQKLLWREEKSLHVTKVYLYDLSNMLQKVPKENFTAANTKQTVWDYASKKGRGGVLWPMRVALSGKEKSPDPFRLADILGKEETLKRLELAIQKII